MHFIKSAGNVPLNGLDCGWCHGMSNHSELTFLWVYLEFCWWWL